LKQISSIQNPFIKNLVLLQEKAKRKQSGTFLIEGQREIMLAKGGYEIETILFALTFVVRKKLKSYQNQQN
jgi:TrmH family RNA methyltransferase